MFARSNLSISCSLISACSSAISTVFARISSVVKRLKLVETMRRRHRSRQEIERALPASRRMRGLSATSPAAAPRTRARVLC
eukprot:5473858-Pleurochrysis_carterae.AAC.1